MKTKFFNWDYFRQTVEETHFIRLCASRIQRINSSNNRILIITPCLLGEFISIAPALFDFHERNKDKKIDLVVAPALKILAEKVIGIHTVYIASSVAGKDNGPHRENNLADESYEKVIILRASRDVLNNIIPHIKAAEIMHAAHAIAQYGIFNLLKNIILRKRPTQWRDFTFHFLGGRPREIDFKDIFNFTEKEYSFIPRLDGINSKSKKIIIHTGASWPMMQWDLDRWVELLKMLKTLGEYEFIFIGQEKEREDYDYISSKLDFKVFSLASKINLKELLIFMNSADYFLGIDSGPANIAHLVGLKSIVLYGPGPHMYISNHKDDISIDKSRGRGLYQRFFLKKNSFISQITVEEVFNAFRRLIS